MCGKGIRVFHVAGFLLLISLGDHRGVVREFLVFEPIQNISNRDHAVVICRRRDCSCASQNVVLLYKKAMMQFEGGDQALRLGATNNLVPIQYTRLNQRPLQKCLRRLLQGI